MRATRLVRPAVAVAGLVLLMSAFAREKGASLDEIPGAVMNTLRARFPGAAIDRWTKEKEGDVIVYDIEFKQVGKKFEADIKEDGKIHNWERAIGTRELPAAVRRTVEQKYPRASLREIMAITAVSDGREELEGYEIVVRLNDGKEVEMTVAPDGRILEDSPVRK